MGLIKDYDTLKNIVSKKLFKSIYSNCFFSIDEMKKLDFDDGILSYEDEGIFCFYEKTEFINNLYFYIIDYSLINKDDLNSFIIPNTLIELPYKNSIKEKAKDVENYFKSIGFNNVLERVQLAHNLASIDNSNMDFKNLETEFASAEDVDNIKEFLKSNFDNKTAQLLGNKAILSSIENNEIIVIKIEDLIAGLIHFENKNNYVEIKHLAVSKEFRGKGYAKLLINEFEKTNANYNKKVWTSKTNQDAILLYEKCGYEMTDLSSIVLYK